MEDQLQQIRDARPQLRIVRHALDRVGQRALELLLDDVLPIRDQYSALGVVVALGHLLGRVGQAHDATGGREQGARRHEDGLAPGDDVVEGAGALARELEVLGLVLADGDVGRAVDEDVGGL